MPAYNAGTTNIPITSIQPGDTFTPIATADVIGSSGNNNTAWLQCVLGYAPAQTQPAIRCAILFSAAPGAFEFDIQESSDGVNWTDVPNGLGHMTVVNSDNSLLASTDLTAGSLTGPFVRPFQKTKCANAVTGKMTIYRVS